VFNIKTTQHFKFLSFFLFTSLLLKLLIITLLKPDYWYDEILLSLISRNSVPQLFNTVLAEWLHPPGFTLFLKILNTDNQVQSKVIITIISLLIVFVATLYAKKKLILSKYTTGLALFFSSYTFFLITSDIKQDALTFPLLLCIFFIAESIITQQKLKCKTAILLFILLSTLLMIGYINYFFGFLLILFATFKIKERFNSLVLLTSQIVIGVSYFPYFMNQYITSKENAIWSYIYPNSIIYALTTSITGMDSNGFISDLYLVAMMTFLIFGIYSIQKKDEYITLKQIGAFCLLLVPFFYILRIFTISRYVAFPFFLICLFAGVGLDYLAKRLKMRSLQFAIIIFLFGMSTIVHTTRVKMINTADKNLNNLIEENSNIKDIGFVTDNHMFPLAYKLWFFPTDSHLIPINAFHPNFLADKTAVSKETQTLEDRNKTNDPEEIKKLLVQNNLHTYLFVYLKDEFKNPYKRQDAILATFLKSCDTSKLYTINNSQLAYIFDNCFED
jgi:hypothetical protein